MKGNLTLKQQRFCDEYLIDTNATQAAIRAGYSVKTSYSQGQRLLKKDEVQDYLSQRMKEKQQEAIASQDEVIAYLSSVLRGTSKSSVLARNEIGADIVIEKPPDEKDKLRAAELLGKRYGIYTEKVAMDVKPVVISGGDDLED